MKKIVFSVLILIVALVLIPSISLSANRYCSNSAKGANNGTSWDNAWSCTANFWGSVNVGDTVFMDGGGSGLTYSGTLTISKAGSSDSNRVTLKIGQDSGHNGVATLNGNLVFNNQNYVTVDGEVSGSRNIRLGAGYDIQMQGTTSPVLRYLQMNAGNIAAQWGWHGLFQNLYLDNGTGDSVISFAARNDKDGPNEVHAYDDIIVEDSHIILCANAGEDGTGADGIQGGPGLTLRNSIIETKTSGCTVGTNHMDFIQSQASWISVYGNIFKDAGDSGFDYDCYNGTTPDHFRIFNNIFIKHRGGSAIRFYGTPCTSFDNIHINNNTFLDHTCCADAVIGFTGSAGATVTNSEIKNNIFYNNDYDQSIRISSSSGWTSASWNIDYNILSGGSGPIQVEGANYTQAHHLTCTPSFVGYILDSLSTDVHLASTDTCAKDAGTSLASQFTTDKDGNTRSGTWDIGAYEYGGSTSGAPPPPAGFSVGPR